MNQSSLSSVKLPPLKEYITDTLRGEIFSGNLLDGQELTQEDIAGQLGVSRIPVREAFAQLVAEGLLIRLPNRHIQVVGLTSERLWQNFHVMAAIESEIALQLITKGNTGRVAEAYQRCKTCHAEKEWSLLRQADYQFHLSLGEALENHTLQHLQTTQHRVLFTGCFDRIVPDWDKVMELDEEIWRTIRAKEESRVRNRIYEYYTTLAQRTVKELKL